VPAELRSHALGMPSLNYMPLVLSSCFGTASLDVFESLSLLSLTPRIVATSLGFGREISIRMRSRLAPSRRYQFTKARTETGAQAVIKAFGRDRPTLRTLGRSLPSSMPQHLVALTRKWIRVSPESTKTLKLRLVAEVIRGLACHTAARQMASGLGCAKQVHSA
jgi:hypothetical protein